MIETINISKKSVDWYAKNCKKATVDQLLEIKTKLVTNNFYLAEALIELKKDYNFAYYSRKIEFSRVKNRFIRQGESATKGEGEATEETSELLKNELDFETNAYRLEQLIKHFSSIADDIMQRISILKKEISNSNT